MIINREWAMPNKWTFTIKPISELINTYTGSGMLMNGVWVDPFAGMNSPAQITNDINPGMPAKYHLDAIDFCNQLEGKYDGVLFDPPYSFRQVSEHYKAAGIKATSIDTSAKFFSKIKDALSDKIKIGGYAICCGWNSGGFGACRGYKMLEILLVAHGGYHNDTIVTVEIKVK